MIDSFALKQDSYNYIGTNGKITGDFEVKGPTIIQGQINGNVLCHNNAELKIDREGIIEGNLNCFDLHIYGNVQGEVNSKGKITLYPNSVVTGNIEALELKIHPGASINGEIKTNNN